MRKGLVLMVLVTSTLAFSHCCSLQPLSIIYLYTYEWPLVKISPFFISPKGDFHITGPHLCHITPIFRQLSSLIPVLRILFNLNSFSSHTFICITPFFSSSPMLIPSSPPSYTPLVCLAWIPADDGTHKASQMRR